MFAIPTSRGVQASVALACASVTACLAVRHGVVAVAFARRARTAHLQRFAVVQRRALVTVQARVAFTTTAR